MIQLGVKEHKDKGKTTEIGGTVRFPNLRIEIGIRHRVRTQNSLLSKLNARVRKSMRDRGRALTNPVAPGTFPSGIGLDV
jgi:hypothetical protein